VGGAVALAVAAINSDPARPAAKASSAQSPVLTVDIQSPPASPDRPVLQDQELGGGMSGMESVIPVVEIAQPDRGDGIRRGPVGLEDRLQRGDGRGICARVHRGQQVDK